ncbi:MAG: hypothetical protein AMJ95_10750 [Omnitrophica WOR_2 bacterium SM23_72]|nr:MAG: hypothetical protein AMJ95_10750 [Omnitrophica WOR_2 bacterium SM23_72]
MYKKWIIFAVLTAWTLGLAGCALLTHRQQIMALKNLGDEQKKFEKYVNRQEKFFDKLKRDIQKQRLVKGIPKTKILSLYGEPIYCKVSKDLDIPQETCLYRHPTRFFSSDLIYLEFDQDQNLSSWEVEPHHQRR